MVYVFAISKQESEDKYKTSCSLLAFKSCELCDMRRFSYLFIWDIWRKNKHTERYVLVAERPYGRPEGKWMERMRHKKEYKQKADSFFQLVMIHDLVIHAKERTRIK